MKTGIHITACNTGSAEAHNERRKEYLERLDASGKKTYEIYRDETHKNSSWVNPAYQGRSLPQVLEDLKAEVKEKTGRAMQAKATPIREGVCPILPTTQLSDFQPVVDWYRRHGAAVIRIDLHHDEGHTDAVSGERKHNHHAHVIVDYIDHRTGKSVKLTKEDISELQGVVAAALRMERGTSKAETGAEHLAAQEYREKKAGESAQRLEARVAELTAQERQARAAVEKAKAAEAAASKEKFKATAADVGARVLGIIGRGAVAEGKKAKKRAEEAEQRAADAEQAAERAQEAQKQAEFARSAAETAERRARREKDAYGREMYENGVADGVKQGRQSVQASIAPLQQQLAAKQATIDKMQEERDERAEALEQEIQDMISWNPNMQDWRKKLADMKEAKMKKEDIKKVFMKGSAETTVTIMHNYKEHQVPVTVAIGNLKTAANVTKHGVWFKFQESWYSVKNFLSKALDHIRFLNPSKGIRR